MQTDVDLAVLCAALKGEEEKMTGPFIFRTDINFFKG